MMVTQLQLQYAEYYVSLDVSEIPDAFSSKSRIFEILNTKQPDWHNLQFEQLNLILQHYQYNAEFVTYIISNIHN